MVGQNYCNLDEYRTRSELADIAAYLAFVEDKLAPLNVRPLFARLLRAPFHAMEMMSLVLPFCLESHM